MVFYMIIESATSHIYKEHKCRGGVKNTVFVTNKRVAKKNRRQKVFLFIIFFQPICKFSGRSDTLLAAGAKGLTMNCLCCEYVKI